MRELFRFVEPPRQCSYLTYERAALEMRVMASLSPPEYGELLARGYRRFGWQLFRPACPACRSCRSLRVQVPHFTPSASQRRVLRRNEAVRAELHSLFVTSEMVDLYNCYHRFMHVHRNWPWHPASQESYADNFLSSPGEYGRQWLYFDRDRLIGVALMDEVPGAISLVYCYYDPAWRTDSPGTFSVLTQLRYAQARGMEHAYLGFWVRDCTSLNYKQHFRPHQILLAYPAEGEIPLWEPACSPKQAGEPDYG